MKSKLLLCILCITSFASEAYTAQYFRDPYIGAAIIQTNQEFTAASAANKLFAQSPQDYAVMAGFRFWCFLGLEAGYEVQPVNSNQAYFLPGQVDPSGVVVFSTETVTVESTYKSTNPYIGLSATYFSNMSVGVGKLRTEALVGLSASKVTATSQVHLVNDLVNDTTVKNFSKNLVVPIARVSAIADLTNFVSLSLSLQYRNMSRFTLVSAPEPGNPSYTIKMKDMFGVGLALRAYL